MISEKEKWSLRAEDVKDAVERKGCVESVLRSVAGVSPTVLDGKNHPCPNCGGKDRFRFLDSEIMFCNQACWDGKKGADVLTAVKVMCGVTFPEALQMVAEYMDMLPEQEDRRAAIPDSESEFSLSQNSDSESGKIFAEKKKMAEYWDLEPGRVRVIPCRWPGFLLGETPESVAEKASAKQKPAEDRTLLRKTNYDYDDVAGMPYLRVTRLDFVNAPKIIFPSHWDENEQSWTKGIGERERIPYNAAEVKQAATIFFVEGEKCAVALENYLQETGMLTENVAVTCIIGGTNGWKPELGKWFVGKTVYILPDNDAPGYKFAWAVKKHIEEAGEDCYQHTNVGVFSWPEGKPEKWDIADELENLKGDENE